MRFVVSALMAITLAGCSVAFQSRSTCPIALPVVDGALAATAIAGGIYSLSLPGTSPAGGLGRLVGSVGSFTLAGAYVASAMYGFACTRRYSQAASI